MKPIIVYPGNFNPITDAEREIASSSFWSVKADKVIFLLKEKGDGILNHSLRKKMLLKALESSPVKGKAEIMKADFSSWDGLTLPLIGLREKFPHTTMYLLLGQDEVVSFSRMREAEKISKLYKILVAPRETSNQTEDIIRKYDMISLKSEMYSDSGESIRSGRNLCTEVSILDFIADNKLYFCSELSSMMKEHRYRHSVSVAKTASKIASKSRSGVNPILAYQAGLFHDCGKDIPVEEQRRIVHTYFSKYEPCPDFALHQFASAYLARNRFLIEDEAILSAISFHCTGKDHMSALEKIIYSADKVEPTREFKTKTTRMVCYQDYDKGFLNVLKDQRDYFIRHNIPYCLHPLSKAMYEYYLGEESC